MQNQRRLTTRFARRMPSWVNRRVVGAPILDFFERRSARAKTWPLVARQKGGEYRPPEGGFFRRTKPAIYAELLGVVVKVTLHIEGTGNDRRTYTVARVPWLLGAGARLQVLRASVFGKMGRALGLQDVATGDAMFDDDFIVKSPTPELVPMLLGARVRRYLRALGDARLDCNPGRVNLTLPGEVTDVSRINLAMDAAAEIASHGHAQVGVMRALSGSFIPPQGPWSSRVAPYADLELRGSRVRVVAVSFPRGVYYALRADLQREVPEIVVSFVDGVADPTPPDGLFDPETFGTLVALGNLTLRTSRGIAQLEVSGDLEADALTRAARWLAGFVEGSRHGAFR